MKRKSRKKELSVSLGGKGSYYAFVFAVTTTLLSLKNLLIHGTAFLYNNNTTINIILAVVSILMYGYVIIFKEHFFPVCRKQVIILFFVFSLWLITLLCNPLLFTYSFVRDELMEYVVYSLPAILFLPALRDCRTLMKTFYICRWFLFAAGLLSALLMTRSGAVLSAGSRTAVYSMSYGRALILPCILFVSHFFKTRNIADAVIAVIIMGLILVFGSRFPFICVGAFVLVKICQTLAKKNVIYSIFSVLLGILICMVIVFYSEAVISGLFNYFADAGVQSRSLGLIKSGRIAYDSGREPIMLELVHRINESPIYGYGAGGGIVALGNTLSHSFILDTFANIGYFGGAAFLILSLWSVIRMVIHDNKWYDREFFIAALCIFAPICFFQTSMWSASWFWILLALSCGPMGAGYKNKRINKWLLISKN